MAEVLGNENDHDRNDERDGVHLEDRCVNRRNAEPGGVGDDREVDRLAHAEAVGEHRVDEVRDHKADEDEELLDEAARPHGNAAHAHEGDDSHPGVEVRRTHRTAGRRGEVEADHGDDRPRHDGRHQLFNPLNARKHHDEAHNTVDETADHDAAQRNGNVAVEARARNVTRRCDHHADERKG